GRSTMAELRALLETLGEEAQTEDADEPDPARRPSPRLGDVDLLGTELRAAGLAVDVSVDGDTAHLPPGIDLAAYRILQEALTNALRHAAAATVCARVVVGGDEVVVDVVDSGGLPAPPDGHDGPAGRGLVGMRERA